jgi:hypothetical protein
MQQNIEVSTEIVAYAVKARSKAEWQFDTPRGKELGMDRFHHQGNTLRNIAIRYTLKSLDSFTQNSLQGIPWHVAKDLWTDIMDLYVFWVLYSVTQLGHHGIREY